jgi:PAS domain S-box-containing protein
MDKMKAHSTRTDSLRQRAEELVRIKEVSSQEPPSSEQILQLLHELGMHQIELEMQNEELRRIQSDYDEYFDLYYLAPIGYLTINNNGLILNANMAASRMLGATGGDLLKKPITSFILPDDQDIYHLQSRQFIEADQLKTSELRMVKRDGTVFWAHLAASAAKSRPTTSGQNADSALIFRVALEDISERKHAEDTIREREEWFRCIFNATSEAIFIHDAATGMILDVNNRMLEFFGYSRQEALAINIGDISSKEEPYTLDQAEAKLRLALTEGPQQFDWQARCKDGTLLWTVVSLSKVSFNTKDYIIAVVRDNSMRKQEEMALEESKTKFSTIFHSSPVAIGISNLENGRFIDVNETFLDMFGCEREEIIGHTSMDLALWPHPDEREKMIRQLRERGRVQQYEAMYRHKSGNPGYLLISAKVIELRGQLYMMGMLSDISDRKQIEESLKNSEERYRRLFEVESDAVVMADCESGLYIDANTAAVWMYGYTKEEFLQLKPADLSAEPSLTEKSIADNEISVPLRWHRKKDGTIFPVEISVSFFEYQKHKVYVAAIRDITKRMQLDCELRQALETSRTSNSTMRRLLNVIAHEFRTPLGLLTGSTDILDHYWDRLTPQQRFTQNEHIRSAANQISNLVSSVTSFNQLGAERYGNTPLLLDIGDTCRGIAAEVEKVWGDGHEFSVTIAADCGTALLDEILFRRILENLLSNAFRYTPSKGTVSLHVRREMNWLLLEIIDTGIGIPEEDQKLIFDAFYRSRNVETRRGLGLGLSIVSNALLQVGGDIIVTSKIGEGTTMQVKIPLGDLA